jgi:flagellar secretion chaperone FliS
MSKASKSQSSAAVQTASQNQDTTPHGLVLMLFDAVRLALAEARAQMLLSQTVAKGQAISKAVEIIDCGLKPSLDLDRGGKIAEQLYSLYDFMVERLTLANLRNEPAHLDVVSRLLAEIEGAWRQIDPQKPAGISPHH